jgi:hypothetical protein
VKTTDVDRIVAWLREHPDSTVMEVRFALYISNVTARMSDARKEGHEFTKRRDAKGHYRYSLVPDGTLGLIAS